MNISEQYAKSLSDDDLIEHLRYNIGMDMPPIAALEEFIQRFKWNTMQLKAERQYGDM